MPNKPVRAAGVLYTGVENDDKKAPPEILRRSEMEQLSVTGHPVFVEHDYKINSVGEIYDSWIDKQCKLCVGVELFGEDRLGAPLSQALNHAVRGGVLKDFSIGFDVIRERGSGKLHQKWMEASLVTEGKYEGTHISIRGSAASKDLATVTEHGSVRDRYIGTRDTKGSFLRVFGQQDTSSSGNTMSASIENPAAQSMAAAVHKMQAPAAAPVIPAAAPVIPAAAPVIPAPQTPTMVQVDINSAGLTQEQLVARHAELSRLVTDQRVQIELKNDTKDQETTQLRARLAIFEAEEARRVEAHRASQAPMREKYLAFAKAQGVDETQMAAIADKMVSAPNDVWTTITAAITQNEQLTAEKAAYEQRLAAEKAANDQRFADQEMKMQRFRDHIAAQEQTTAQHQSVRASKRSRTSTVDEMFDVPAAAPQPGRAAVKVPKEAEIYPASLVMRDANMWGDLLSLAAETGSAGGQPRLTKHDEELMEKIRVREQQLTSLGV